MILFHGVFSEAGGGASPVVASGGRLFSHIVMCQLERLQQLKTEIHRIAVKNNARKVYVFGSCARKEETPDSDVDFIADFNEHATLFDHAGLELDLAELLGCEVDVVTLRRLQKDDEFSKNVKREMLEVC